MRIGFVTMFAFRPHVEHVYFLAKHLGKRGNETFFLNCRGALSNCYNLMTKRGHKALECSKCFVGSLYSYEGSNTTFLRADVRSKLSAERLFEMTRSSAYTLTRIEDPRDMQAPEVLRIQASLDDPVEVVYENARRWVKDNKLDAVLVFNGRMDATRAIIEGCADEGVRFACVERSWSGHGVQITPGANCLSLAALDALIRDYRDRPLTAIQARHAAASIVRRFKKRNHLEWRAYNVSSVAVDWPVASDAKRILILPSSKNEKLSHPEWGNPWDNDLDVFAHVVRRLGVPLASIVVRGHPSWSEPIWGVSGERIETYYADWCRANGIHYIGCRENADSAALMQQADVVLLNGSSAAYEAGIMGKEIVSVGRCQYQAAEMATVLMTTDDLDKFGPASLGRRSPAQIIRQTLRFLYTYGNRFALFNRDIRARTTTSYRYADGFDVDRLVRMLTEQRVIPDDETYADDSGAEDVVVDQLLRRAYDDLAEDPMEVPVTSMLEVLPRRMLFRWVDGVRNLAPRGDLATPVDKGSPKL